MENLKSVNNVDGHTNNIDIEQLGYQIAFNTGYIAGIQEVNTQIKNKKKHAEKRRSNNALTQEFGKHTNVKYGIMNAPFNKDGESMYLVTKSQHSEIKEGYFYLKPADKYRFAVLAANMNYSNNTKYPSYVMLTSRTPLENKTAWQLLNITQGEWSKTKKELIKYNLIKPIKDGKTEYIQVNTQFADRGAIKFKKGCSTTTENEFARIYTDGIMAIHKEATSNQHKFLGLIIDLLPYVNRHWNILCEKEFVDERDMSKVKPLRLKSVAELLGKTRKRDRLVLCDNLLSAQFGTSKVFLAIEDHKLTNPNPYFILNPKISYQGDSTDDKEALTVLTTMFNMSWQDMK